MNYTIDDNKTENSPDSQSENQNTIENTKKLYNGSTVCILSSHLFLISSLFNYYYNNIIECIMIFILYLTSIFYHYNGESKINILDIFNLDCKTIDVYCCRIVIPLCMILSLLKYNIYPTFATLFIVIMYYTEIAHTNTLHSLLIHLPGMFGFLSIYYNNYNNTNNTNTNTKLQSIISHAIIIWISLIIISCLYLLYYDFYLEHKITLLNINIKNLNIVFLNKINN